MRCRQQNWRNAAIASNNLCELELTLGDVSGAVHNAEQSIAFGDLSGKAFERLVFRETLTNALHQAGRRADAIAQLPRGRGPGGGAHRVYSLLHSVRGFQYCDLLLAEPERRMARISLGRLSPLSQLGPTRTSRPASSAAAKSSSGQQRCSSGRKPAPSPAAPSTPPRPRPRPPHAGLPASTGLFSRDPKREPRNPKLLEPWTGSAVHAGRTKFHAAFSPALVPGSGG